MGDFGWEDGNETKTKREIDVYIFSFWIIVTRADEYMNSWPHQNRKISP
jgi:hypothetical protein